jgi:hypothetical protein
MSFFIHNLHWQMEKLHKAQHTQYENTTFIVYRGQGLFKNDLEKVQQTIGGLMSFNSFLSTSNNRNVSEVFAESATSNPDMVGVLFIMCIDWKIARYTFAILDATDGFLDEEEILFSMHKVLRIRSIQQLFEPCPIIEIKLNLI